jgi:beta-glucosidase
MSVSTEPVYKDAEAPVAHRVADLLSRMTTDEKIGQMVQVDRRYLTDESVIATHHFGSLLSGGGSSPTPNTPENWADMVDRYQRIALSTRLGIPILYGTDAVHGHNNMHGSTIFPHQIGLGAADDADLNRRIGEALAVEVVASGPRWTFAPCIAVARNERWGRTFESPGEVPALASTMAAMVTGLQTDELGSTPTSILSTLKHYVGDGGTTGGLDRGDTEIDEEEMRSIHIAPYLDALAAGAGSVMISYSAWNGVRLHGHKELIIDVLRGELGFDGFVVSDWAGVDDIDGEPGFSPYDVTTAVNAGIDLIMVPEHFEKMLEILKQEVASGAIPMERVDEAVSLLLVKKFELGLFEDPFARREYLPEVRGEAHLAVAREAVAKSVVLLRNEGVLPLAKDARIFVAGKNADDIGHQCGGWTLTWQGGTGSTMDGTSILDGIREVAGATATVDFAIDGSGAEGHDVAIVVVGEEPYAEMFGDRLAPDGLGLDETDLATLARVRASGVPMVVVLVSGRPLILTGDATESDALVAAWLPGTEGAGVADVLFGDRDPVGKLPHSWPRTADQVPINVGDADYDPLFPFGFGLAYA